MRDLITVHVNGPRYELAILPHHTLLEVLISYRKQVTPVFVRPALSQLVEFSLCLN